jgi:hypothetical protein
MSRLTRTCFTLVAILGFAACGPGSIDGQELAVQSEALSQQIHVSSSLILANTSAQTGKVTICHYPPGNPANMHTLSVGAPAVPAHVQNHGDTIGPCGPSTGGDLDAGTPVPSSSPPGGGTPDAGVIFPT